MAVKKKKAKKAASKKTTVKAAKKTAKKAAKKPAGKTPVKKKAPAGKKAASAKHAPRHVKPKLGFDPLSREDIDVLTASGPGEAGPGPADEGHHTGIDALIRDTNGKSSRAAGERPAARMDREAPVSPQTPEEPETVGQDTFREIPPEPAAEEAEKPSAEPEIEQEVTPEPEEIPVPETRAPRPSDETPEPVVQEPVQVEEPAETVKAVQAVPVAAPAGQRAGDDDEEDELTTYFSFRLGNESFALPIERVKEVFNYQNPTKVPKTPSYMLGVINLRGGVVPVVGLRLLFGMPEVERTVHSAIIILDVENEGELSTIGLLVDSVREVVRISDSDVDPTPRLGTGLNTDFIKGMGKHGGEFLMILDIDTAFSVEGLR